MLKRILSFIGWSLSAFLFLIGFVGLTQPNSSIAIALIIWGFIFLPPLYRFTWRYGRKWNIVGRLLAFILAPIFSTPSVPPKQVLNTPPTPTATVSLLPKSSPVVVPYSPSIKPSITPQATTQIQSPTPTPIPSPSPTPTPTPTPIPKLVPSSKAISKVVEPSAQSTPQAKSRQVNPNTQTRKSQAGNCECPYDKDSIGRSCGKRSAYSRQNGRGPICYEKDLL
jgi:hypothetical protein